MTAVQKLLEEINSFFDQNPDAADNISLSSDVFAKKISTIHAVNESFTVVGFFGSDDKVYSYAYEGSITDLFEEFT